MVDQSTLNMFTGMIGFFYFGFFLDYCKNNNLDI